MKFFQVPLGIVSKFLVKSFVSILTFALTVLFYRSGKCSEKYKEVVGTTIHRYNFIKHV